MNHTGLCIRLDYGLFHVIQLLTIEIFFLFSPAEQDLEQGLFINSFIAMRQIFFFLLSVTFLGASAGNFHDLFHNKTLRIDYIHSGNANNEYYALDELIREPVWDRTKTMLINPFDYGTYKFQAYDSATGELIYQTSYCTLFGEWRTTDEAKKNNRAFHETVLMPFPRSTVKVEFSSRMTDDIWKPMWTFFIDPEDVLITKDNAFQCDTRQLLYQGDPSHKLDVVFIAEGYTKRQMGKFRKDAKRFMDYILDCEPFNENKELINFWLVESPSRESGTDNPGLEEWKSTVVNSHFWTFYTDRYLTTSDNKTLRHLASNAPYDQIIVIVNDKKYGGGGFYNTYAMCTSDDNLSSYVLVHEFGHSLAGLGDEYYTSDVAMQDFYPKNVEPWEPNLTTLKEFNKKWKDQVKKETPVPTPADDKYEGVIGVFEGGGYSATGVYRPYLDCTMLSGRYNNFCPVCKKAISDMILFYSR